MESVEISVHTGSEPMVVDITAEVAAFVEGSGDGLVSVFVPHATAGVAIFETGAGSDHDLLDHLDTLLPRDDRWRHRHGSPGHGADHVLPAFVAPSITVPVIAGRVALGTWQSVVLVDPNRDNPHRRCPIELSGGMMAAISLEGVTVQYKTGPPALDTVDLDVIDGELLVVAGPSGSGKTTLLRTIAGFQKPTSGRLLIDGIDRTRAAPGARDLSMVFQDYALYPTMTAGKNIEFPLIARGVKSEDERERRVHAEARSFRIDHLLERMPGELSMGHRQAVSTARAMVRSSKALLMDEPLSNLDARFRDTARLEVRRMHESVATTIVYVTNDQTEAMSIGSRVAVLDRGVLQQVASPLELFRMPVNTMVAGFIGMPPMRMLPGELEADGDRTILLVGTDRLDIGVRADVADWIGLPVTAGIRPGDVVASREQTPFERCLHGRVVEIVDYGADLYATVDIATGSIVARLRPGDPHRPGSVIEVTVAPSSVVVFDPASGKAISPSPVQDVPSS